MNTLLVYLIIILAHLSIYYYHKLNRLNLEFLSFNASSNTAENIFDSESKVEPVRAIRKPNLGDAIEQSKQILLNKNLRQLEFIAEFEMYLEEKTLNNLSIEFLQEFEKIKIEAQLSTLKSTSQLHTLRNRAA